jgi:hypothetical protein
MSAQIEVELSRFESHSISEFWKAHGKPGFAMIAQPIKYLSGYYLRLRIVDNERAENIAAILDE